MTPAGVIRPIALPDLSVNHMFPSGPLAISIASWVPDGRLNSVMVPAVVMRPILVPFANHNNPGVPAVIPTARMPLGIWNSVICPALVILPMFAGFCSVNQTFPSDPSASNHGNPLLVGTAKLLVKLLLLRRAPACLALVALALPNDCEVLRFEGGDQAAPRIAPHPTNDKRARARRACFPFSGKIGQLRKRDA